MIEVRASEVEWDLQTPCGDCPFRNDVPWHAGIAAKAVETNAAIRLGRFAHTCHKTDNRAECDGPRNWKGKPKHCAGAILMLLKTGDGLDLQLPLLRAAEAGTLDLEEMTRRAKQTENVFTLLEFLKFQMEGAMAFLGKKEEK